MRESELVKHSLGLLHFMKASTEVIFVMGVVFGGKGVVDLDKGVVDLDKGVVVLDKDMVVSDKGVVPFRVETVLVSFPHGGVAFFALGMSSDKPTTFPLVIEIGFGSWISGGFNSRPLVIESRSSSFNNSATSRVADSGSLFPVTECAAEDESFFHRTFDVFFKNISM